LTVGGGETETERLEGNKSERKKEKIRDEKERIAPAAHYTNFRLFYFHLPMNTVPP
jgi:hypothetical protein